MPFDPFAYPPQPRFSAGLGIILSLVLGIIFILMLPGMPGPMVWIMGILTPAMLLMSIARYVTNKSTIWEVFDRD